VVLNALHLQCPHLPPFFPQLRNTLPHPLEGHEILDHQQVKLLAESQEMREEGVVVRLDGQVEYLLEVGMVEVGEDAEEVLVDVFGGVGEGGGELAACSDTRGQHDEIEGASERSD